METVENSLKIANFLSSGAGFIPCGKLNEKSLFVGFQQTFLSFFFLSFLLRCFVVFRGLWKTCGKLFKIFFRCNLTEKA